MCSTFNPRRRGTHVCSEPGDKVVSPTLQPQAYPSIPPSVSSRFCSTGSGSGGDATDTPHPTLAKGGRGWYGTIAFSRNKGRYSPGHLAIFERYLKSQHGVGGVPLETKVNRRTAGGFQPLHFGRRTNPAFVIRLPATFGGKA